MNASLRSLAERIRNEISEIEPVLTRLQEGWQRARSSGDDLYIDSVALNLHGLYSGLERIFVRLAESLDSSLPAGENWHQTLLIQMTKDVVSTRPAVISSDTCQKLDEYRGFRHVVRNVYTFHFDPEKLEGLVVGAKPVFEQVKTELLAFARFLDESVA